MWRIPAPLIAGGGNFTETFTADEYIGNLYTYLGSPSSPTVVNWQIDGCDLGEIIIPNTFAPGSSFSFTCVNGGRILGEGGAGGVGGADFGTTGDTAGNGNSGTPAISSNGFNVSLNIDDGFLFGGGGGGGGGAYSAQTGYGHPGGGGGGGQGWSGGSGGSAGAPSGVPSAANGGPGSRVGAGAGGSGAAIIDDPVNNDGGAGGTWGLGGRTGIITDLLDASGNFLYYGGLGGQAGAAFSGFNGGSLTLTGSSSETTLRSQGRILGQTSAPYLLSPFFHIVSVTSVQTGGIRFETDGDLTKVKPTPETQTAFWLNGSLAAVGSNYEARVTNLTLQPNAKDGTFSTSAAADGTWISISAAREWNKAFAGADRVAALFDVRRNDHPGVGADDVMMSFYHRTTGS